MRASRRWLWVALLLLPSAAWTDAVHLKNGGVVRGVIVERTNDAVVMEVGPGRVTLPLSRIARIDDSTSAVAVYHERLAAIRFDDIDGLANLARWAGDHYLATYARETWERVLALDPGHPEANAALGRTYYDGQWMGEKEANRLRGYVPFEGRWVTPSEQEAILRERTERELATNERRQAELRVREAEAYADQQDEPVEGIPYWWVLSGGGTVWPPGGYYPRPPTTPPEHSAHPIQPARPPRTGPNRGQSIWKQSPSTRPPAGRSERGVSRSSSGRVR